MRCTLIQPRLAPHFAHPLPSIRDLDPGVIGADDDIVGEDPECFE